MASCSRAVWRVVSGCPRLAALRPVHGGLSQTSLHVVPVRTLAVARTKTKESKEKKQQEEEKKEVKKRAAIDDSERHKPFGKTAWAPVDDVFIRRFYPRTLHPAAEALELLKAYRVLDFTPEQQPVYVDLRLDMKLEKKRKVDPFVSTVHLPHPFKTDMNKVLVFTEDPDQAKVAQENGAVIVGGAELIQPILEDEISADFYVAVPDMLPKLVPLKNKLRKKFPKSKRGSVGMNVAKMLDLFKTGHEYMVEDGCFVRTQIATLDMPSQHILDNLHTVIADVHSHRQQNANLGPFIERAIVTSQTSEALWIQTQELLPQSEQTKEQEEEEQQQL